MVADLSLSSHIVCSYVRRDHRLEWICCIFASASGKIDMLEMLLVVQGLASLAIQNLDLGLAQGSPKALGIVGNDL